MSLRYNAQEYYKLSPMLGLGTSLFFSAHYAMLQCLWILPKMLKIMLTIHV